MSAEATDLHAILSERDTLAPRFRSMARRVSARLRRAGPAAALALYDALLPALLRAQEALLIAQMRYTVEQAQEDFAALVKERYGRTVDEMAEHRAILRAAGDATDVIQRIAELPDRWGYTYSMRIWRNQQAVRLELSRFMQQHVNYAGSVAQETKELARLQYDDPTLPKRLQSLERSARRMLHNVPGEKQQFLKLLETQRRAIDKLTPGERGTRGFNKQFLSNLNKAIKTGSAQALDGAVDTFVHRRARYRAQVLLRSEVNRAYGEGALAEYRQHGFVQAVRWIKNPLHKVFDECDLKALADIGLGPGVYYIHSVPWPDHPVGRCKLDPVMASLKDSFDAQPFYPENDAAYQQVLEQLQGPWARAANHLGRQAILDTEQRDAIIQGIPKVLPLPSGTLTRQTYESIVQSPRVQMFLDKLADMDGQEIQSILRQLRHAAETGEAFQLPDGTPLSHVETLALWRLIEAN